MLPNSHFFAVGPLDEMVLSSSDVVREGGAVGAVSDVESGMDDLHPTGFHPGGPVIELDVWNAPLSLDGCGVPWGAVVVVSSLD